MKSAPLVITPLALPFDAEIRMPGSKSHANRALIAAALSPGKTLIRGATPCDDVRFLLRGLQTLGFSLERIGGKDDLVVIHGGIPKHRADGNIRTLHCGNAGTVVRFLTALACIVPGRWIITGDEHMRRRPIRSLVNALRELGAEIDDTDGCPPLRIRGGTLSGNACTLDATKSSQYLTALLLIAPALPHGLSITLTSRPASASYLDITRRVLRDFGVRMHARDLRYTVSGRYTSPKTYAIEGDWSAAGAFLVLAELSGSRFRSPNLESASAQGDRKLSQVIGRLRSKGNVTIDVSDVPDQLMNLCVLAAHRKGKTTFTGAANLRIKETDRLAVIVKELRKAGITIEEHDDGVIVSHSSTLKTATLDPHDDHRMAMAFAILGSVHKGIRIQSPQCVSKSYPRFFSDLALLSRSARCIALIGMRGVGKSSLGKTLAKKLKLHHRDSDAIFQQKNGIIRRYVERKSWKAFRKIEENIIEEHLQPGCVFSLGGGAIESAATRNILRERSLVVWMSAPANVIVRKLRELGRPPLTNLPLEREVALVLKRRNPFYQELSDIELPSTVRMQAQVPFLVSSLKKQCSW